MGAIPGYATYLDASARAVKYMKMGGWIGLGVAGLGTTNDVYHACTVGRESECPAVAIKGYASFLGGTAGGIGGGAAGAMAGGGVCVALGIITAPSAGMGGLACALVGSALGGLAGGYLGEQSGEFTGELLTDVLIN